MNCCCVFVQRIGWIKSDIVFEFNNGTICICSIHLEVAQNFYACFILSFHFVVCSKIKYFSNLWWTTKKDWITRYFGEHFFFGQKPSNSVQYDTLYWIALGSVSHFHFVHCRRRTGQQLPVLQLICSRLEHEINLKSFMGSYIWPNLGRHINAWSLVCMPVALPNKIHLWRSDRSDRISFFNNGQWHELIFILEYCISVHICWVDQSRMAFEAAYLVTFKK